MNQDRKNVEDIYLVPPTQHSMLLYMLLENPAPETYFEQYTCTLRTPFDPVAWRAAWNDVLARHAAMRTQFLWAKRDRPLQVVRRELEMPWEEEDWRALSEEQVEQRWNTLLATDVERGIELDQAPLMRCTLVRLTDDSYRFLWTFTHLLLDGWSMALVLNEVSALYRVRVSDEKIDLPAPVPFRNFVGWVNSQDLGHAETFWRRELAGIDAATALPFDGTGRELGLSERHTEEAGVSLDADLVDALSELARRQRVTLSTLFQAAWALVLSRFTGEPEVVFGVLCSGRPAELPGIDRMVGLFINALPARVSLDPNQPLADWLTELQERVAEIRQFEYVAGEQIRAWSEMPRREEVFRSVVVFENYPVDPLGQNSDSVLIEDAGLREAGNFPLTFFVNPFDGQVKVNLMYHRDRFSEASIQRLLAACVAALHSLVDQADGLVGEAEVASAEDQLRALEGAVGPQVEREPGLLHAAFEEVAEATPDRVALVVPPSGSAGDGAQPREISYAELEARSRQLALQLRAEGVGPEVVVGLVASRSAEVVLGMLAVLRAGGCYVPLDPALPAERVSFMIEDSGAHVLLVTPAASGSLPEHGLKTVSLDAGQPLDAELPALGESTLVPSNLAYVIYTSGSTGRPKGVGVSHAAALHYTQDSIEVYGVTAEDRLLQFSSVAFDTCVEEIYPALCSGATLVLRDDDSGRFLNQVREREISVLNLPTAFWSDMARDMARNVDGTAEDGGGTVEIPPTLRVVIIGGEEAQADRVAAWRRAVEAGLPSEDSTPPTLFNTYGPTESTVVTTRADLTYPAEHADGAIPIGRPISNATAYVLNSRLQPQPEGIDGELCLGGAGTARGYLGKPSLTAQAFVPDPHSATPGARLYRSGDLARWLPSGQLEFRGRIDHQVKVRGYRVEMGEVEIALRGLDGVRDAVAMVRADRGDDRIVGYWIRDEGAEEAALDLATLRAKLAERLPEFMMPAHFVELDEIPLTATGKVDRNALPAPGPERPGLGTEYVAPRTPTEEVLAGIWSELLGVEQLGVHDDFFELGGHSLLVARLTARVRASLGAEVPMAAIFDHSTVAGLAKVVGDSGEALDIPEPPPLVPMPRDGRKIPLSLPQERVWFLDRLSGGGNRAYNFQVTIWLYGPLKMAAFRNSLAEIVRRHEVLRTSFPEVDGEPVQRIHPPGPLSMPVVDLSGLSEVQASELSERLVFTATEIPFDLTRLPLIRWWMLRLEPEYHELIQIEHHFVHDGWSFSVILNELKALYGAELVGASSPLPELPVQYADYALWQRSWMEGEVMGHLLEYWKERLEGASTLLDLPTDRPRLERPNFDGDMNLYSIPTELYQRVRAFGRREGFTLYMTSLAAFFVFLYRYTGQSDILVGTTNANRRTAELEKLLGMLVNTLVLRGELGGDPTFRELLGRVRDMTLGAYNHQDMPLERLVRAIDPERHVGRNPLFQVLFQFHDAAIPDLDFPGDVHAKYLVRGNRTAKMDLTVIVIPRAEQRVGMSQTEEEMRAVLHWEYSTELFDEETIHRQVQHFLTLLGSAVADPDLRLSELPMMSEAERLQLTSWNEQARRPAPAWTTVSQAFLAQAEQSPEAPAVGLALPPDGESGDAWSYSELAERSGWLASYLAAQGVGPETLVAVSLRRSPWMVATLLAVGRVGAAYVPLDPEFPRERLAFMLEDSGAELLVTEESLLERLPEADCPVLALDRDSAAIDKVATASQSAPTAEPHAANLAYVLYTSGSTGKPKGVEVSYGALANFLASMADAPGFTASDTLLAVTTLSFDIAGLELYLPLITGGRLALADAAAALSGSRLAAALETSGATVMQATPATWRLLLDDGWRPAAGLRALCGGEALPPSLVAELAERGIGELWNLYGPTETTVWSALDRVDAHEVAEAGKVSIGRPVANNGLYLSSKNWEVAPVGVDGQLMIGGAGLARGYHGRPGLTAERFLPDPFSRRPGERLYATGDLARRRLDGRLDFHGRIDHQVKVRGFRIELGEIEAALGQHPEVGQAVVAAWPGPGGTDTLVAYLVPASSGTNGAAIPAGSNGSDAGTDAPEMPAVDGLVEHLRLTLPAYMVPSAFVMLRELPLTPNGKVDRKALPEPGKAQPLARAEYVAPRTPMEQYLAELWGEVLLIERIGIERIGVNDSFFALGGHSLAAGRVLARIRDRVGVDLPLSVMFDTPTIDALSTAIEKGGGSLEGAEDEALKQKAAAMSDDELDALLGDMLSEGGAQ